MRTKRLIKRVAPYVDLYHDTCTGIAWIENGTTGCGHSCHPNIHASGSIAGMKRQFWGEGARVVKSHGFAYDTSRLVISDGYDELARKHCTCGGFHGDENGA